jgi:hypothetical protein
MWLHYLSHKLGRLLLPFALIVIAVTTPQLPLGLHFPAAIAQLLVYGLAATDPLIPQDSVVKRLSSPARTFVVLMAASAAAASIVFLGSDRLWKSTAVAARTGAGQPS